MMGKKEAITEITRIISDLEKKEKALMIVVERIVAREQNRKEPDEGIFQLFEIAKRIHLADNTVDNTVSELISELIWRGKIFQHDKTKDGWELVKDVGETKLLSANKLELTPFLFKKEVSIEGEELVERAKKMQANLGQRQAEHLLSHQDEIPEKWRKHHLVFPGTIWRVRDGRRYRYVPYLGWDGKRWYLYFRWLGGVFCSDSRLLRPRE